MDQIEGVLNLIKDEDLEKLELLLNLMKESTNLSQELM